MGPETFKGREAGPYEETATREAIGKFARAVGVEPGETAPPTFVTRLRRGEFDLLTEMGIPLHKVLHGEQEYEYRAQIRAGDHLSYRTRLAEVFEKKGKTPLTFLVFETKIQAGGAEAAIARTTIVLRGAR